MLQVILISCLVILAIWLIVVSFILWQTVSHYNSLTKGVANRNLKPILEAIMAQLGTHKDTLASLHARYDTMEKASTLHIQKIGLTRFNPFKDTGGDQSFILTLVDGNDTGVVISALYSRSGTRWYAKRIINGKGQEHELSDDEKKALKETVAVLNVSKEQKETNE